MSTDTTTNAQPLLRMALGRDSLLAAAAPVPGAPSPARTVQGVLYSGGLMQMGWMGAYVINLQGVEFKPRLPLLHGHDSWSAEGRIGYISASVEPSEGGLPALVIRGAINTADETGRKVVSDLEFGVPLETSVGIDPVQTAQIAAGQSVQVNGRTLAGPFTFVQKSVLREASIVTLGADPQTTVALAAARARRTQGLSAMEDTTTPAPAAAPTPAPAEPAADSTASASDETVRVADITREWLMKNAPHLLEPQEAAASVDELEAAYAGCVAPEALSLAAIKSRMTASAARTHARTLLAAAVKAQAEELARLRATLDPVAAAASSAAPVAGAGPAPSPSAHVAGCRGEDPASDWDVSPDLQAHWKDFGGRRSFMRFAAMQQRLGERWDEPVNAVTA